MVEDSPQSRVPRSVVLVVEYQNSDELIEDYTANLSAGGTFVHTERNFETGTAVDLVLSFPGLLQPIQLAGVVRWATHEEEHGGVGIEFVGHDDLTRARLDSVIDAIRRRDPRFVGRVVRVLVVDDNPHILGLITDGLSQRGRRSFKERIAFDFVTETNGQAALNALDQQDFDVMITDVHLPLLDGYQLMRRVRESDRHRLLPILAVSADEDTTEEAARSAGADLFLNKPLRLRGLIEQMVRALSLAASRREAS